MEYIFTIDLGTQSVRSSIIDLKGNFIDIEKIEIDPYFSKQEGWAEQHPEYFWEKLCESSQNLLSRNKNILTQIKCVTVSTQRATVINVDKEGKPLRPAILWLDKRRAKEEAFYPAALKGFVKLIGMYEPALDAFCECEWNWLKQNEPEVISKTHKYLFLSGYLTHQFTGKFIDSIGNIVGYVPFDYKNLKWLKKDIIKRPLMDVPIDKLPELVKPATTIGTILPKAAKETGLPEGIPLIASAADKACEITGLGVNDEQTACLSLGTMATVNTSQKKYFEVLPFMPSYPSAKPGFYNTELAIQRGFWMISWFKSEFAHSEIRIAEEKGLSVENILNEFLAEIPAGSEGLVLQPYWSSAARNPGPEAKGAIIGFSERHTRKHIYKAVIEGIVYGLKDNLTLTEKKTKTKITRIRVGGGGSQSDSIMQIVADVFNLPAERVHSIEASSIGAAINAAVGMGHYKNVDEAITNMVHKGEHFKPIAKNVKVYHDVYNNVYKKMYQNLKPFYLFLSNYFSK